MFSGTTSRGSGGGITSSTMSPRPSRSWACRLVVDRDRTLLDQPLNRGATGAEAPVQVFIEAAAGQLTADAQAHALRFIIVYWDGAIENLVFVRRHGP